MSAYAKPTSMIVAVTCAPHGCMQNNNILFRSREKARAEYDKLLVAVVNGTIAQIENEDGGCLAVNCDPNRLLSCSLTHVDEMREEASVTPFTLHPVGDPDHA